MSASEESPVEKLARRRLEAHIGPLSRSDVPGTSGVPDYKLLRPKQETGDAEVTSTVDRRRAVQRGALRKSGVLEIDGLAGEWHLHLRPHVDSRRLRDDPRFRDVLDAARSVDGIMALGRVDLETAELMQQLGVEGARYRPTGAEPGRVLLSMGTTGAGGLQGRSVDDWLSDLLQESHIVKRMAKLKKAGAEERHLYVSVDTSSRTGLGIGIALDSSQSPGAAPYDLPTVEPPDEITDLWIWPDQPGPGLRFQRGVGWSIVSDVPWQG